MSTLYIIGNGFDRAHGLKTSYWDFRNYLEKYAEDFLVQLENMYSIAPFERLDKRFRKNKEVQKRRDDDIYETLWKNFEYFRISLMKIRSGHYCHGHRVSRRNVASNK